MRILSLATTLSKRHKTTKSCRWWCGLQNASL